MICNSMIKERGFWKDFTADLGLSGVDEQLIDDRVWSMNKDKIPLTDQESVRIRESESYVKFERMLEASNNRTSRAKD